MQNIDKEKLSNQEEKNIQSKQKYIEVEENDTQNIKFDEEKQEDQILVSQVFIESNIQKATQLKNQGNKLFSQSKYLQAIEKYRNAIQYTYQNQSSHKNLRAIIYLNISISLAKLSENQSKKQILKYCKKAVKQNPLYEKAWVNLGKCYQITQQWEQALQAYKKAYQIQQKSKIKNKFVEEKIKELQKKVNEINQKKKQQVIGGLKTIGNNILGYFGMSLNNFKLKQGTGGGYNISYQP